MSFTTYYTASSLDGFIADAEHSLDWLLSRKSDGDGPMGFDGFIAGIGAMVAGANTYQWLLDNDPDAWPFDMPCWILTHREFAARPEHDIRFTSESVPAVYARMAEAAGDKKLWVVGGGELAGQFADHGLLDEIVVSYAPVMLGSGAPLLPRRLELTPTEVALNGELTCARYAVVRD
ncbi:MAG: bifunctional deaminase-reductase domain protein [Nocardia sp.]|uniref:dihydrofolate reductase family protein n=1 Tax=Nocardia sp. TaxID=1821 RepID=UPI002632EC11|nr:dihydrofolate reductase family protein [Nocardia sp.]MCU1645541.1 bifunctional deaminase-reductase domain protein [Nocardia sp.]